MNMTFLCHSDTISLSNLFDLISHETCDKNKWKILGLSKHIKQTDMKLIKRTVNPKYIKITFKCTLGDLGGQIYPLNCFHISCLNPQK